MKFKMKVWFDITKVEVAFDRLFVYWQYSWFLCSICNSHASVAGVSSLGSDAASRRRLSWTALRTHSRKME